MRGFGLAASLRSQNFHVKLVAPFFGNAINQAGERGEMHYHSVCLRGAEAAVKVPEINAFGQLPTPFTFDVFADLVLDRLQYAVAVFTFDVEFECFFHGAIMLRSPEEASYPAHSLPMHTTHSTPSKEEIALLAPFERLELNRIALVSTAEEAIRACAEIALTKVLGFDTESKPTFFKDQVSEGPHIVQLATTDKAWVFQLHDLQCRAMVGELLSTSGVIKAGFGLGDDRKRIIAKLGVEPADVLELNTIFREQGYRKDMGVKGAVAVLFNQRFIKSKKAATSNWANPRLTEAQLVYAANDAYAAVRVFHALKQRPAPAQTM